MSEQMYRIKPPAWKREYVDHGDWMLVLPYGRLVVHAWTDKPGVLDQYTDGWDEPIRIECGTTQDAIKRGEQLYFDQVKHWLDPA